MSCISSVIPCYTGDGSKDNTCDSHITECKTACSALRDICASGSNDNSQLCSEKYNKCLGADEISTPSVSCIKAAEQAYLNGTAENSVSALSATCKQTW